MRESSILIVSHVTPGSRASGQQQRVYYTLRALRGMFRSTVVTAAPAGEAESVRRSLEPLCDEVVLLPYPRVVTLHKAASALYPALSGLKRSNYWVGRVLFSPQRLASAFRSRRFDCVLYEYWHAAESTGVFRSRGIPCVLDMHDVLWQASKQRSGTRRFAPGWWKRFALERYRAREEAAWRQFDGIIAINREEQRYVQAAAAPGTQIFWTPMGADLTEWPYCWHPAQPPRVAYYGGLASRHNQESALLCFHEIMPVVWRRFPQAEFWVVGSQPPDSIRALARDPRVTVTGFVKDVQTVLRTMLVVLCPWSGTYGFRSRVVEAMALGVPVVASFDAVFGMGLEHGKGLCLGQTPAELAQYALRLLAHPDPARDQSRQARTQVESQLSFPATYGRLASDLREWLQTRKQAAA